MLRREREQPAPGSSGGRIDVGAEARDLRAYERPIRDVVVGERRGPMIAAFDPVPIEQPVGEVAAPESLEIHRQERDVGEHVAESELVVEFEAIQEPRAIVQAEHVLGEQIAVAVADAGVGDALTEQRLASGQVAPPVIVDARQQRRVQLRAGERGQLVDVARPRDATGWSAGRPDRSPRSSARRDVPE